MGKEDGEGRGVSGGVDQLTNESGFVLDVVYQVTDVRVATGV